MTKNNLIIFKKNEKMIQEIETDKKFREHLSKLDKKISHLKQVLESFQNSYKNIKEYNVDGVSINPIEYEYLGIDPNVNNTTIQPIMLTDEDLDGEPI